MVHRRRFEPGVCQDVSRAFGFGTGPVCDDEKFTGLDLRLVFENAIARNASCHKPRA
jgi:hypothetical protein